jgi:hypothetical protein
MRYENKIEKTIIVGVCWILFILLNLVFNPGNFGFWQTIGTILMSSVVAGGIVAMTWVDACI